MQKNSLEYYCKVNENFCGFQGAQLLFDNRLARFYSAQTAT